MMTNPTLSAPAWMRGTPLEDLWLETWVATGDGSLAMEAVRQSPIYDEFFAGNRREDGSIRYDENTYLGIIESFEDTLLSINLNPDIFREYFVENIEGNRSPAEFASAVNAVYEQVIQNVPEVAQWAATTFNLDATPQALIAMAIEPRVGEAILSRKIAMSEVGGAAATKNFTIGANLAEKLVRYGTDTFGEAAELFAEANVLLPAISTLARRHNDPDDDFSLEDFTNAAVFGDPEQRRTMRRLIAQERVSFGPDQALALRRSQEGAATGLEAL